MLNQHFNRYLSLFIWKGQDKWEFSLLFLVWIEITKKAS